MTSEAGAGTRLSFIVVAIAAALGLLADYFFFGKAPGIGFTAYAVLVALSFIGVNAYLKRPLQRDLMWLFPVLLFFAGMVAIRANLLLAAMNMFGCILLLVLIAEVNVRGSLRRFVPLDYILILLPFPFSFVESGIKALTDVFSARRSLGERKEVSQLIRGAFITVPVLVLFTILFASADLVFESYVDDFFDLDLGEHPVLRSALVLSVAAFFCSIFAYAFMGTRKHREASTPSRPIGRIETSMLLGSVNALFLAFIAIQIAYLFGGESNITAHGLTYAEYARKGFFELIAVSVFSYLILLAVEKFVARDEESHSLSFRMLSAILVAQLGIIMVSAFMRLSLYEAAFGYTTLRIYSHAFIILLAVVFAFLLYKILIDHRDDAFAFRSFLAVVTFVAAMNLFNPDAFIAEKNLGRYEATGKLDTAYLATLSADAAPTLVGGLSIRDEQLRGELGLHLYLQLKRHEERAWVSWNHAKEASYRLLSEREGELKQYEYRTLTSFPPKDED